MPAVDIYEEASGIHLGLFTRIYVYMNLIVIKPEFGTVKLEAWSGDDPINKSFQVSANTTEPEKVTVGEYDQRMCELPLYLTVGDIRKTRFSLMLLKHT